MAHKKNKIHTNKHDQHNITSQGNIDRLDSNEQVDSIKQSDSNEQVDDNDQVDIYKDNKSDETDNKIEIPYANSESENRDVSDEGIKLDKSNDNNKSDDSAEDNKSNKTEGDKTSDVSVSSDDNKAKDIINKKKKRKLIVYKTLRILFTLAFFVFAYLFIDEVVIQPYKMKKVINKAKELYHSDHDLTPNDSQQDNIIKNDGTNSENDDEDDLESNNLDISPTPTPDPNRDAQGRLKKFQRLIEINEDVKGWITIDNINGKNDTKIDYVVVQSDARDPEYYLHRSWMTNEYLKAGSLFLDYTSSVEKNSQNLIIHGHNMTSSDDMFHYLLDYNEASFLKEHPIISFDTIYEEAFWKVFAIVITPGNDDRDDYFQFLRSDFSDEKEFLDFVYQLRIRSIYNIDDVDINENDQILTLSTCSYELSNYRTLVIARKVRDGEDISVDTDTIKRNKKALYPASFYKQYGGKAPELPTFDEALENDKIPWYKPID